MPGQGRTTVSGERVGAGRPAPRARWSAAERWLGLAGQPWPARVLIGVVCAAALATVVIGIRQPTGPTAPGLPLPARIGIAAALAAAAQLARLRFRLGPRTVSLSGGEAAFILGFALVPAGWLPAATLAGAAAAWTLISVLSEHRPPVEIAHLAASLTLGVAGATAVAAWVAGPASPGGQLDPAGLGAGAPPAVTPALGLALLAGCGAHLLITAGLSVLTLALHRDVPVGLIVVRTLHGRLPVFAGNVLLGLFVLLALDLEPGWLLLVPPVVWLLHRSYRLHLRAEDERRLWPAFARATRSLGATTEQDVAAAGIRGALEVFGARRVEVAVLRPGGRRQRWVGDDTGAVTEVAEPGDVPAPDGWMVGRPLTAIGAPIGELTLWLSTAAPWSERDELAVAAYGDALANALHDAATQQRLGTLGALASHRAVHDPLTGLRNRAALLAQGDELLQSLGRSHPVALLLVDLNGFSRVNATLGQHAGMRHDTADDRTPCHRIHHT